MIFLGEKKISELFIGDKKISEAYLSEVLVYGYQKPVPPEPEPIEPVDESKCIKFYTINGVNTLSLNNYDLNEPNVEYRYADTNWETLEPNTPLEYSEDRPLYIRGLNPDGFSENYSMYSSFHFDGNGIGYVSGNIMNLINYNDPEHTQIPNDYCFYKLFAGNTYTYALYDVSNLTLPATELRRYCYANMFEECIQLGNPPSVLPATELADDCYSNMFENCMSLQKTPELPAEYIPYDAYREMFANCASLNEVHCNATNISAYNWLIGVSETGTFYRNENLINWSYGESGIPWDWEIIPPFIDPVDESRCLKFTTNDPNGTCYVSLYNEDNNPNFEYRYEDRNWEILEPNVGLSFASDMPLYIRGFNPDGVSSSRDNYSKFIIDGDDVSVAGNIMNLIDYNYPENPHIPYGYDCFYRLFSDSYGLVDVSNLTLPAIRLGSYCYANMFDYCTSLVKAPELPATELAEGCYSNMFRECRQLEKTPELPAEYIPYNAYREMFMECESLNEVHCNATQFEDEHSSTMEWLFNVSETGTFYRNDYATQWELKSSNGIPENWEVIPPFQEPIDFDRCMYLATLSDEDCYVSLRNYDGNAPVIEYRYYNTNWTTWDYSELDFNGQKPVFFRGVNENGFSSSYSKYSMFVLNGSRIHIYGNVMSLVDYETLPTTIPNDYCFYHLFWGEFSTGLENVRDLSLPATELTNSCYGGMFALNSSLTEIPSLPAEILAPYCYSSMFAVTGIDDISSGLLPATRLAEGCYDGMFKDCKSMRRAPELPATEMVINCYKQMFDGCESLFVTPYLPAETLAQSCYFGMFAGCSELNYVYCNATDMSAISCTYNWLQDVSNVGEFTRNENAEWELDSPSGIPTGWAINPPYGNQIPYVALSATSTASTRVSVVNVGGSGLPNLQYSTNGNTWNAYTGQIISIRTGSTSSPSVVYFRGMNPNGFSNSETDVTKFVTSSSTSVSTNTVVVSGNVMSLIDYNNLSTTIPNDYCFRQLFSGCSAVTSVSEDFLPAKNLKPHCYSNMFRGCTKLTTPPELPAKTLAESCYRYMFGQTRLTKAPLLPATALTTSCYAGMFYSAITINEIHCQAIEGITTGQTDGSVYNWTYGFSQTSTTGTFYKHPNATDWITGTSGYPRRWEVIDETI